MTEVRGWFKLPEFRAEGDRTVEEQMHGLDDALAWTKEARAAGTPLSVLDLGCAEGCISREFALAGARDVFGIELLESHLEVARKLCADVPQVRFQQAHLQRWAREHRDPEVFDIVLALSVVHKLEFPALGLRFAARSARHLLLLRVPSWSDGKVIRSKQMGGGHCEVLKLMQLEGFGMEKQVPNKRKETLQYWRRKA